MNDSITIRIVRLRCRWCDVELSDDTEGAACSQRPRSDFRSTPYGDGWMAAHQWEIHPSVVVCPCDRTIDPRDAADMGLP